MQNSTLYRRGVVLPLDEDAEKNLRKGDVSKATNVRLLRIASDELFADLWHLWLFREINKRCSTIRKSRIGKSFEKANTKYGRALKNLAK